MNTKSLKLEQEQGSGVNCLELRLGISSDNNGSSPWRVADPWSLAARQEKASLEKAQQRPDECDLQRENRATTAAPTLLQPVGWPPVRAFHKNHLSAAAALKPADAILFSKVKPEDDDDGHDDASERPPPMFVKVNLEGCAVGRKVDLNAHRGYGSLSRALQTMFHGFLSDGQRRIASDDDDKDEDGEQQPQVTEMTKKQDPNNKAYYILLYEDNEGDRMLVGDVPWELFVASVKRLYIAQDKRRTRAT